MTVTNATEFATAVTAILKSGANGNLDQNKCRDAQAWLRTQPNATATVTITAAPKS